MRTILVVTMLLLAGVTLVAAAPTASACTPPNCPGWGGCRLKGGDVYVDPDTFTVSVTGPYPECYY